MLHTCINLGNGSVYGYFGGADGSLCIAASLLAAHAFFTFITDGR